MNRRREGRREGKDEGGREGTHLYELIHFPNMFQIIVSEVGRMIRGS